MTISTALRTLLHAADAGKDAFVDAIVAYMGFVKRAATVLGLIIVASIALLVVSTLKPAFTSKPLFLVSIAAATMAAIGMLVVLLPLLAVTDRISKTEEVKRWLGPVRWMTSVADTGMLIGAAVMVFPTVAEPRLVGLIVLFVLLISLWGMKTKVSRLKNLVVLKLSLAIFGLSASTFLRTHLPTTGGRAWSWFRLDCLFAGWRSELLVPGPSEEIPLVRKNGKPVLLRLPDGSGNVYYVRRSDGRFELRSANKCLPNGDTLRLADTEAEVNDIKADLRSQRAARVADSIRVGDSVAAEIAKRTRFPTTASVMLRTEPSHFVRAWRSLVLGENLRLDSSVTVPSEASEGVVVTRALLRTETGDLFLLKGSVVKILGELQQDFIVAVWTEKGEASGTTDRRSIRRSNESTEVWHLVTTVHGERGYVPSRSVSAINPTSR